MARSVLSYTAVLLFSAAAAAGWTGTRLPPLAGGEGLPREAQWAAAAPRAKAPEVAGATSTGEAPNVAEAAGNARVPGVRDRAAWQPSPVVARGAQPKAQAAGGVPAPAPPPAAPPPLAVAVPRGPAAATINGLPPAIAANEPAVPAPVEEHATAPVSAPAEEGASAPTLETVEESAPSPAPSVAPAAPSPPGTSAPVVPNVYGYIYRSQQLTSNVLAQAFDGGLPEQRGEWREQRFFSRALGADASYLIWLPPGYGGSTPYPTLYLLHGVGGLVSAGAEEWLDYGISDVLDRLLALGLIEPMIVILPNGEQGYWMNHADGGPRWADYVAQDLVRHVDATFNTEPSREGRAIGGLSMGGHGALQIALNRPDEFSAAGAHSPTLRSFETSPDFFGDQHWFAQYDPLSLVRATDAAPQLATWIDVGHQDGWRREAGVLRAAYESKGAPLEFRMLEGTHESSYWQTYLPEYLRWYSAALHAPERTPEGAPVVASYLLVPLKPAS